MRILVSYSFLYEQIRPLNWYPLALSNSFLITDSLYLISSLESVSKDCLNDVVQTPQHPVFMQDALSILKILFAVTCDDQGFLAAALGNPQFVHLWTLRPSVNHF
jgi:hypothetical protein